MHPYLENWVAIGRAVVHYARDFVQEFNVDTVAPNREFTGSSLRWIPISGLSWSLYKWMAVYRYPATETPLRTTSIREGKGIFSQFWVSVSSRYELRC